MKSILVTGGAGFIGSHLVKAILDKFCLDVSVCLVDNLSSGSISNIKKSCCVNLVCGDVTTSRLFDILHECEFDFIVHLASITDTTILDEKTVMESNVGGFRNILNFAIRKDIPVIYASSAGVYGNGNVPMSEEQELCPLNPYSSSKKEMDYMIRVLNGFPIIGLRFFNVYGERENHKGKSASMVYQLMQQMMSGNQPRIFEHGEQSRDFVYVDDVADAILLSMDLLEKAKLDKNLVLNVGTGISTSFNRVVSILNEVLDTNLEPDYFKNPYEFFQNVTRADIAMSESILGFKAKYDIESGISNMVAKIRG